MSTLLVAEPVGGLKPGSNTEAENTSSVHDTHHRLTPHTHPSATTLRRPRYDTRWKQQRNYAFRMEYTVFRVLILSTIFGLILLIFGGISCPITTDFPKLIVHDYTNCLDNSTGLECFSDLDKTTPPNLLSNTSCKCVFSLRIEDEKILNMKKILVYYQLDNFFQNSRVYKRDVEWSQMEGKLFEGNKPIQPMHCSNPNGEDGKYTYPCGRIANSYFTDVFRIFDESTGKELSLVHTGIAWSTDKHSRFKNPTNWDDVTTYYSLPHYWHDEQKVLFLNGSTNPTFERGVDNENFMIWVRTAALRKFRKKYAILKGLTKGNFRVEIDYRYEVKSFHGRKAFVIGGDHGTKPCNAFFCFGFIIVGSACLLMGPTLYFVDVFYRCAYKRKMRQESREESKEVKDNPDVHIKIEGEGENESSSKRGAE